jgi:hypothetical protein
VARRHRRTAEQGRAGVDGAEERVRARARACGSERRKAEEDEDAVTSQKTP